MKAAPNRGDRVHTLHVVSVEENGDALIRKLAVMAGFKPDSVSVGGILTVQFRHFAHLLAEVAANECTSLRSSIAIRERILGVYFELEAKS